MNQHRFLLPTSLHPSTMLLPREFWYSMAACHVNLKGHRLHSNIFINLRMFSLLSEEEIINRMWQHIGHELFHREINNVLKHDKATEGEEKVITSIFPLTGYIMF